jgi:small-conductance mechanosensitive channel
MTMDTLLEIKDQIAQLLNTALFELGETPITLWTLIYGLVLIALFVYLVGRLRRWIVRKLLVRVGMDVGAREATGAIIHYTLLVVGFIIILQTIGIDLTILNVLAGTLGIGLGFGLQNIVNNFVSGLIILFERPIKVGDRIEVGDVHGRVTRIGARSATILTNDNIAIIVPNLKFITDNVINWSHSDEQVRFRVPVTVAADSDLGLVQRLLLEAAREDPDILDDPGPGVRLLGFGENGLKFELRAWSHSLIHRRGYLVSKLNLAIAEKFAAHGIEIPNPQRDIHIRSGSLEGAE